MMIKFFFFGSLAHLIMSSSVTPQCDDFEQIQYDDFELVRAFHKYLAVPSQETYNSFKSNTIRYYKRSPIDCLNLLDRYRGNLVFKVLIWRAFEGSLEFIDPTQ